MIELLFVACLSGAPEDCRERSLLFDGITPIQCLVRAQPQLAIWVDTHPKFTIQSWRCRRVSPGERDA
ncbi:MAG: hypothetical protein NXH97_14875 [Rhodobacteraceae bacterium]|nr:hypothetical protein [Paracoccaceae bacterium]